MTICHHICYREMSTSTSTMCSTRKELTLPYFNTSGSRISVRLLFFFFFFLPASCSGSGCCCCSNGNPMGPFLINFSTEPRSTLYSLNSYNGTCLKLVNPLIVQKPAFPDRKLVEPKKQNQNRLKRYQRDM